MHCPFCSAPDTKVVDSRLANGGDQVRRRRSCVDCNERFTTFETVELNLPRLIKSNGVRVNFDEAKLRAGMSRALEKRPVSDESIEAAINKIKRRLYALGEREVSSSQIGTWVMEALRKLDQVAYVRFASVYRRFEDIDDFSQAIADLAKAATPEQLRQQIKLLEDDEDDDA